MEIEGYENYLIYEDGKVYNQKFKRYLRPGNNGAGYLYVIINYIKMEKGKLISFID